MKLINYMEIKYNSMEHMIFFKDSGWLIKVITQKLSTKLYIMLTNLNCIELINQVPVFIILVIYKSYCNKITNIFI